MPMGLGWATAALALAVLAAFLLYVVVERPIEAFRQGLKTHTTGSAVAPIMARTVLTFRRPRRFVRTSAAD